MSDRLTLLLAFHNHQPEGNFAHVFEESYRDCYGPLVEALLEAPQVRVALHHTGALLEWIEAERPGYFESLRRLVGRGQVELLGGGFYEPMLAVLPERDAHGQIGMMSDYLERHFGARPQGMWLAERVWEPALAKVIADAGMRFTLVDDGHFRAAGLEGLLRGHYVTEKAGTPLAIFPIDKRLREAIPFSPAAETIALLDRLREESPVDSAVTYGDDGEKFGVWPKTKEWVWERGWVREFFGRLGEVGDRIATGSFSEWVATRPPTGRVYLPTASYEEMGEWALPAATQAHYHLVRRELQDRGELDRARPFLHGGIWQGFLAKYPEANFLHKKMIRVSDKVARARARLSAEERGHLELATQELYRAQCNCCYWHGLFGGLYLNYLRDAVYRHLLVAEAFADARLGLPSPAWAGGPPAALLVEEVDLDADLEREVAVQSAELDLTIRPHEGGTIQELAFRPKTFMLTNVLGRHPEGYHQRLRAQVEDGPQGGGDGPRSIHDLVEVKEPGLDRYLVYDRWNRYCFVDHFLPLDATLDELAGSEDRELGDFVGARYTLQSASAEAEDQVVLRRRGTVAGRSVELGKRFRISSGGGGAVRVAYTIELIEGESLATIFAPELSLTLLAGDAEDRFYRLPDRDLDPEERLLRSRGTWDEVESLALVNDANRFRLTLDFEGRRASVWRFPLETVSNSEAGFERTYQGSVLVPRFPIRLAVGERVELAIELLLQET